MQAQREHSGPFDIAVAGATPPDTEKGSEIVQPYVQAGATWWVEVINPSVGSFVDMRHRAPALHQAQVQVSPAAHPGHARSAGTALSQHAHPTLNNLGKYDGRH